MGQEWCTGLVFTYIEPGEYKVAAFFRFINHKLVVS